MLEGMSLRVTAAVRTLFYLGSYISPQQSGRYWVTELVRRLVLCLLLSLLFSLLCFAQVPLDLTLLPTEEEKKKRLLFPAFQFWGFGYLFFLLHLKKEPQRRRRKRESYCGLYLLINTLLPLPPYYLFLFASLFLFYFFCFSYRITFSSLSCLFCRFIEPLKRSERFFQYKKRSCCLFSNRSVLTRILQCRSGGWRFTYSLCTVLRKMWLPWMTNEGGNRKRETCTCEINK